ncbi:phospholipase D-like domain-containing protein [uncultured Helicobacter sp.]|uniref:phospholipase D-like domain-containing protein n=1 Tax=uncultured Helicobacter sp. TaxID=175537 RepID=UPI002601C5F9|nr:phospholipase D-like domain-containing protein [uncultured Helicobacter sp.]
MFKKVFVILGIFIGFLWADALYFMPQEQNKAFDALLSTIKNTQQSLDIAIYSFTNREISKAIRDIAKRGVQVRIIYDKKSNQNTNQSTIGYLAKLKNVEVCLLEGKLSSNKKFYGLMHTKMAISDKNSLVLGSANWSKSAFETNYETLLISQNKEHITKAKKTFEAMFQECEKY